MARRVKRKHKTDANSFVLSRVLRSKQTGREMNGMTVRRPRVRGGVQARRVYFDAKGTNYGKTGVVNRKVTADSLEDAVVPAVFNVFADRAWIAERVEAAVASLQTEAFNPAHERDVLVKEREDITRRLTRIHRTSEHLSDEELDALVRPDNERIVAIRLELAELDRAAERRPPTVDEAVSAVMERLDTLPENWRSLPNEDMKLFFRSVIESLEVDLDTFNVEMRLRLPESAMHVATPGERDAEGGVRFTSAWCHSPESSHVHALRIEKLTCTRTLDGCARRRLDPCYTCRRHRSAA
jgi:hypothetical protein